jgi:hypothetical protein
VAFVVYDVRDEPRLGARRACALQDGHGATAERGHDDAIF